MAFINEIETACQHCGTASKASTYGSINVAEQPELKAAVKDGSLFVWECPHCGRRSLLKFETLYHDPDAKLMIWLLPEGAAAPESLEAGLAAVAGQLDGYTLRRVSSAGDLIEKVNIHDAGLDDIIIEMCKYVTKMELSEKMGKDAAEEMFDAPFKFYRMEGADNEITLSFPLGGAMQGVNIGFNVYEDCRGIVQRNPSIRPAEGFAKIDAYWLKSHFR